MAHSTLRTNRPVFHINMFQHVDMNKVGAYDDIKLSNGYTIRPVVRKSINQNVICGSLLYIDNCEHYICNLCQRTNIHITIKEANYTMFEEEYVYGYAYTDVWNHTKGKE